MRLLLVLVSLGFCIGCYRKPIPPVPVLCPIAKISATLHDVPELSSVGVPLVEVPPTQLSNFATLITPHEPYDHPIWDKEDYHVADIFVHHPDGTSTKIIVRWTGTRPAAVSLDGHTYFYGGQDDFHDGAIRIIRLLNRYHDGLIK